MDEKIMIRSIDNFSYNGKTVLLRVDINSPIDPITKKIVNDNRINMSIPTIRYLLNQNAKLVIIAHQGDTLDYHNLIPLNEHALKLSQKLKMWIDYIDDVAGPAALEAIKQLSPGQAILLGNLRYLTEEVSTFEDVVKLDASEMLNTYLVRSLAPVADYYVNDAFSAAHRNSPSMVAFQEILPSAGGKLLLEEFSALSRVKEDPAHPALFILGGAKISDAFSMMRHVLENGAADRILACGVTGHVMLIAKGYDLGKPNLKFIRDRSLEYFIQPAKELLAHYKEKIVVPVDLAYEKNAAREECGLEKLPVDYPILDVGEWTIKAFKEEIDKAETIFMNGPVGVYENPLFVNGTKEIFKALSEAGGYTVIGGGDTVSAAERFIDKNTISYVSTAGGAMIRFLSGIELPLIKAMEKNLQNFS